MEEKSLEKWGLPELERPRFVGPRTAGDGTVGGPSPSNGLHEAKERGSAQWQRSGLLLPLPNLSFQVTPK